MEMPTAYIKRLQQFIRQCDRILYPAAKSMSMTNPMLSAFQNQLAKNQVNGFIPTRPEMKRYASQDSSNWAESARSNVGASNYHMSEHDQLVQEQKIMNKQRKQKGTLVMKSSHNSSPQINYSSPPTTSAELQQQQKQQLLVQQLRMQRQVAAHQYMSSSQSSSSRSYHRTHSVPIIMPQQSQVNGGGTVRTSGLYGRE
jgi:hypothetical protein